MNIRQDEVNAKPLRSSLNTNTWHKQKTDMANETEYKEGLSMLKIGIFPYLILKFLHFVYVGRKIGIFSYLYVKTLKILVVTMSFLRHSGAITILKRQPHEYRRGTGRKKDNRDNS